jgi:hypothetical protein
MAMLRYLLFAVVGVVVASALFVAISFVVSANFEAGTDAVERWILRATCDQYELMGRVRDSRGRPVAYAVVEVAYLDERLATRSGPDGSFRVAAAEPVCDRRLPPNVSLLVMAEDYRPKQQQVAFDLGSIDVSLDPRDFRR